MDAIEKAGDRYWIDDSWYKQGEKIHETDLWQIKCGANVIGILASRIEYSEYVQMHKKLRAEYTKHPLALKINDINKELTDLWLMLREKLLEFADMEYLPGYCDLCHPTQ